jgi:hypothetical protein
MKDRPKPEIHNTKGTIKLKFLCLFHPNIENQRIRGKFAATTNPRHGKSYPAKWDHMKELRDDRIYREERVQVYKKYQYAWPNYKYSHEK